MLSISELKLLGEFVESSMQAGLIRTVNGAINVSHLVDILNRELNETNKRDAVLRSEQQTYLQKAVSEQQARELQAKALGPSVAEQMNMDFRDIGGLCAPAPDAT